MGLDKKKRDGVFEAWGGGGAGGLIPQCCTLQPNHWVLANLSQPIIHESVVANLSKCACKQSFNNSRHKHGVTK